MNEKEVFAYLTNLFETEYKTTKASAIELARNLISAYGTQELDKRIKANKLLDGVTASREIQLYNKKLNNAGIATEDIGPHYDLSTERLLMKAAEAKKQYDNISQGNSKKSIRLKKMKDVVNPIKKGKQYENTEEAYGRDYLESSNSDDDFYGMDYLNSDESVEQSLLDSKQKELKPQSAQKGRSNSIDYNAEYMGDTKPIPIGTKENRSNKSAKQVSKVTLQTQKLPSPKYTPQEKKDLKTLEQAKEAEQRLKEANTAMPKIDNVAQRFEYIDKAFYDKMPDETKARFSSAQVIKVDYVDMNGKKGVEEKVRVAVPINERVQVDELNVRDNDSTIVPYQESYKDDYEVKRAKAEEDLKIRDQKKMENSDEFIGPKEPEEYADGGNITVDMVKQAEKQKDLLFKSLAGLAAKAMKYKDGGGLKLNEVSKFNYSKYKS